MTFVEEAYEGFFVEMAKRTQDEGALRMIQELEANLEQMNSSQAEKGVEKMESDI